MKRFLKWLAIILGVLIVIVVGGFLYLINRTPSTEEIMKVMDKNVSEQVKNQYDLEKTTSAKQTLNLAQFRHELDGMSEDKYKQLEQMVSDASIPEIQAMYKSKKLSVEDLVVYYLKRIEKYDVNKLNAVMELNPDAIRIAKELDAHPTTGKMYGIPVLIKGNIGTGDQMHTTAGAYALKDSKLDKDSFVVKQLRQESALILGKTNLSEFANYLTSTPVSGYSALGGQTHSPYGKFDVGGSSSGSAVAAAAGFSTVTIGTETAGSIIYPSSQNSVVGIKPSLGLVSRDRIIPITEVFDTPGVITKHVSDAALTLGVISGSDAQDAATGEADQHKKDYAVSAKGGDLKGKKLVFLDLTLGRTGEEQFFQAAEQEMKDLGAETVHAKLKFKDFKKLDSSAILDAGFKFDLEKYLKIAKVSGITSVADIVRINNEDLANRAAWGQDMLEASAKNTMSYDDFTKKAKSHVELASAMLDKILKDNGADAIVSISNDTSGLYAGAGYPAITVPAGYKSTGEPLGLTIVGTKFSEDQLIHIASAYEQATKHRKDPSLK
ncbi:amidase family protein [Paenibacillus sp. FSL R10-2734]|uniref:amidase family protein n=1 Tax=Paenibacillus sp. FSL R10-2734 TaxID=2954691 RepID=UPI0030D8B647